MDNKKFKQMFADKLVLLLLILLGCVVVSVKGQIQTKNPSLEEVIAYLDTYHPTTPFLENVGECYMNISCVGADDEQTQTLRRYGDLGVCMLHSFWPTESLRAFREVIRINSTCAMGYWGLLLSLQWDAGFIAARNDSITLAQLYADTATPREQLYIQAEANQTRWSELYQQIIREYPEDIEAQLLWAWNEVGNTVHYIANPLPDRAKAQQFLQNMTLHYPSNLGLHHYILHAWEDTSDPAQAVNSSNFISSLNLNVGHIAHMPGHIFHRLGDHNRAYEEFLRGYNTDLRVMDIYGVTFHQYWEFIHNIAYTVANLGEGGRRREAISWGNYLQGLKVNSSLPLLLDWDPIHNRAAARYYFQGLIALPLLYFQYSDWSVAQQTLSFIIQVQTPILEDTGSAWLLQYFEALQNYACVLGSFNTSDDLGLACYEKLKNLYAQLDTKMNRPTENGYQVAARAYNALGVHLQEAEGIALAINGSYTAALLKFAAANVSEELIPYNEPPIYVRPVLRSYADTLLLLADQEKDETAKQNYYQRAIGIYEEIVASPWHNNSGFGLFRIGYVYVKSGKVDQAKNAFVKFLQVWHSADGDLFEIQYAKAYLAIPSDVDTDNNDKTTVIIVLAVLLGVAFVLLLVFLSLYIRSINYRKNYEDIKDN